MLECTITGISQEMDLEKNETVTYMVLRLSNGTKMRAAIDEASAALIVSMQVEAKGVPQPAVNPGPPVAAPAVAAPPPEDAGDGFTPPDDDEFDTTTNEDGTQTHVFGGRGADDEERSAAPEPEPEPPEPAPPAAEPPAPKAQTPNSQTKPRQPKPPKGANGGSLTPRARTVPAGEGGYPVVPNSGVDAAAITSSRDQDEDGVGSV